MARPRTKAGEYERLTLRLPKEMVDSLRAKAEHIGRPLNTQVMRMLEASLRLCEKSQGHQNAEER